MALADRVIDKKYIKHLKCEYCEDIFSNPRILKTCSHVYCYSCLSDICNLSISDPNPNPDIKPKYECPAFDCQEEFTDADISTRMLQL